MYFIQFNGKDEKHKEAFELFYQSIVATDKNADRDNEDDFIALLQQLKRISTASSVTLGSGGIKLRDLNPEGGSIALEGSQYKLLVACMERPIWRPHVLEAKRDALKWLKDTPDTPVTPSDTAKDSKVLDLKPKA